MVSRGLSLGLLGLSLEEIEGKGMGMVAKKGFKTGLDSPRFRPASVLHRSRTRPAGDIIMFETPLLSTPRSLQTWSLNRRILGERVSQQEEEIQVARLEVNAGSPHHWPL